MFPKHQLLHCLQEVRVFPLHERLVSGEAPVRVLLPIIPPDLRRDCLGSRSRNSLVEPAPAVDEMLLSLQPQPDPKRPIDVTQSRCFPQDSAPKLRSSYSRLIEKGKRSPGLRSCSYPDPFSMKAYGSSNGLETHRNPENQG